MAEQKGDGEKRVMDGESDEEGGRERGTRGGRGDGRTERGNKREGDGEGSRGEGEKERLNEPLIQQRDRRREGW